ncbi:hypothetical protein J6590_079374 [Homalodisca vitripennis]|nr:hypothetical protein J6590_079374 [Homalodisca vitripennis]
MASFPPPNETTLTPLTRARALRPLIRLTRESTLPHPVQLRKTFLSITQSGATHTAAAAAVTQRGKSAAAAGGARVTQRGVIWCAVVQVQHVTRRECIRKRVRCLCTVCETVVARERCMCDPY